VGEGGEGLTVGCGGGGQNCTVETANIERGAQGKGSGGINFSVSPKKKKKKKKKMAKKGAR